MEELLIKTIINQARTIQRYDTSALESLKTEQELKERIKELEEEKETLFVGKSAAKLYQKELVKAEKRIKELEKPSE